MTRLFRIGVSETKHTHYAFVYVSCVYTHRAVCNIETHINSNNKRVAKMVNNNTQIPNKIHTKDNNFRNHHDFNLMYTLTHMHTRVCDF